ncbi:transglutaminase family protein [Haloferula sp. A504]|uniref:transglutaminase family protein n=1 Tax=Haloferula sp. A504 TaxID=3373601 RepID=UPI0031CA176D|nr:transglutaminase-like domain-containing protein [Verrucomicrobiaceae bacterium E54]
MSRSTDPNPPQPAPRLLLGASLLLWGGITGRPLVGLILALAVEAAHWTRIRWDFGDPAYLRAWQVSIMGLLVVTALVWLDGSALSALPRTITWLPVVMLPLQFVQSYGIRRSMSLANLSLFMRKRRAHAQRHGLPFRDIRFSFDNVFLPGTLIAASLGEHARSPVFFPALLILLAVAFFPRIKSRFGAVAMLGLAAVGGYGGERVLDYAYRNFVLGSYDPSYLTYSRQTRTAIGELGEIKQSPAIQWRLIPRQGDLPKLLRIASYNAYVNTYWSAKLPARVDSGESEVIDFETLGNFGTDPVYWITAQGQGVSNEVATHEALPRFTIRGGTPRKGLFPIPGNAASMVLPNQDIEINPFGTLRVDPRHPVADALVLWGDPMMTALPPWSNPRNPGKPSPDLQVPAVERDAIARLVEQLELRGKPLPEQISRLRSHFLKEFTYTRYLSYPRPLGEEERGRFVSMFLEETKRGHCEYFATATAFILRECGVPTRYATGFSVVERDPKSGEALIRGTHGHAWCLAWDESRKKWIDVDLTPPDWTGLEAPRMPAWQGLLDRWHILRDNILVWRSQPGNLGMALALIFLPLLAGAVLIGRRLWRSKRRIGPQRSRAERRAELALSPLGALEKPATPLLGERPLATPLARWLRGLRGSLETPDLLDEALAQHQRLRFDPRADEAELRQQLEARVPVLKRQLRRIKPG